MRATEARLLRRLAVLSCLTVAGTFASLIVSDTVFVGRVIANIVVGACCLDGGCKQENAFDCEQMNGTFLAQQNCSACPDTPTSTPTNTPTDTPSPTPTNTPTATPTETPVPQGGSCLTPSQCQTGFCVDGVCCDQACNGPAQVCNPQGVCVPSQTAPAMSARGLLIAALVLGLIAAGALLRRRISSPPGR